MRKLVDARKMMLTLTPKKHANRLKPKAHFSHTILLYDGLLLFHAASMHVSKRTTLSQGQPPAEGGWK